MIHKPNWIRWFLALALGWQLLGAAAPAYADTTYTVRAGDTLNAIALRYGVTLPALMAANGLTNANLIFAGQQLVIPEPGAAVVVTPVAAVTPPAVPAATTYIVVRGDNLQRIATRFGVSQQALMAANGLTNANFLMAGQRLVIPAADFVPTPVAVEVTPAPPANTLATPLSAVSPRFDGGAQAAPTPAPGGAPVGSTVYVVKAGDTLWGLTRRFGVSLAVLKSANGLYNDYIHVGQQLIIPSPGATVTPVVPPLPVALPPVEYTPPATRPVGVPALSWYAFNLYHRGVEAGHDPNAFSVAGDCNSDYDIYLGPVVGGIVDLSSFPYLQVTLHRFWGSFARRSLAVHGGYNARSVMDPLWANPQVCQPGESPFACELRVNNSSIVFISLGTGDQFAWRDFEKNYRKVIEYAVSHKVLPVLVTKADKLETSQGGAPPNFINDVIRRLGAEYGVPVIDLWLAAQAWPNGGLLWEGGQDFHLSNEGNTLHNMTTLHTLDVIWRGR